MYKPETYVRIHIGTTSVLDIHYGGFSFIVSQNIFVFNSFVQPNSLRIQIRSDEYNFTYKCLVPMSHQR